MGIQGCKNRVSGLHLFAVTILALLRGGGVLKRGLLDLVFPYIWALKISESRT